MLHRIQISTNTCEVTMQVKRAIGKVTLQKLPIYSEYLCLCRVSTIFCIICCFPNVVKALLYGFDTYIKCFTCVVNFPRSHVPVLLAMRWSVASRSALYRGREHLWIVFSFNTADSVTCAMEWFLWRLPAKVQNHWQGLHFIKYCVIFM